VYRSGASRLLGRWKRWGSGRKCSPALRTEFGALRHLVLTVRTDPRCHLNQPPFWPFFYGLNVVRRAVPLLNCGSWRCTGRPRTSGTTMSTVACGSSAKHLHSNTRFLRRPGHGESSPDTRAVLPRRRASVESRRHEASALCSRSPAFEKNCPRMTTPEPNSREGCWRRKYREKREERRTWWQSGTSTRAIGINFYQPRPRENHSDRRTGG
jgi:hypothetical protein